MNKQNLIITIGTALAIILGVAGFMIGRGTAPEVIKEDHSSHQQSVKEETVWTCSMHPQIKLEKPGKCPICGMELIPLKKGEQLGAREIKLSPMAEKLADIEAMPVIRKEFYLSVPMVGKISLDETRSKKITSRYAGRLDRLFVDYTGIEVKKGDHLFEIYSPQLITAQEELLQAIESTKVMQKSSVEAIRISSEKAVDASRDKLRLWGLTEKQIATFEKTKIITDHLTTYSPQAGIVIKKHLDEGSYVKEGTQIYSIANLDYLWVELDAYESDLQWLHYAQEVTFEAEALLGEEFKGRISFIHPVLNNKTRTVKVRVNVDNKRRRLKPDMFVRAKVRVNVNAAGKVIDSALAGKWISPMHPEIISDKPGPCPVCDMPLVRAEEYGFTPKGKVENPLLVPASAPLITGKRSVVYLKSRNQEGVYEGRTVTLGLKAADWYIVKSGLKQGDLVVTKGAFKIDSALQIQAKPSMMSETGNLDEYNYRITLPFKKSLSAVYENYDTIAVELSKDSFKGVNASSAALLQSLAKIDESKEESEAADHWRKLSREIELSANLLQNSKTLESARKNFERLSIEVITAVRIFGTVDDINLAYCPMAFNDKGAAWLQKSDELANPYFGSRMYHCGDFKEKFSHQIQKVSLNKENAAKLTSAAEVYFKISGLLAEDKTVEDSMFKSLESLLQSADMTLMQEEVHLAYMKELNTVKEALKKMDKKDLAEQRKVFKIVSEVMINLMNNHPFLKDDSFVLRCPMAFDGAGADWLQKTVKTKNPYMGHKMQMCGDVKANFKAAVFKKEPSEDPHKDHKEEPSEDPHEDRKEEPSEDPHKDHKKEDVKKISDESLALYLKIHKALSQDRFPELNGKILTDDLKRLNAEASVVKAVEQIFKEKDIKDVRKSFKILSDYLILQGKKGSLPQSLNLSHCPMAFDGKGAFWLQTSEKVENPYYGSRMYRCGSIKEKISGGK